MPMKIYSQRKLKVMGLTSWLEVHAIIERVYKVLGEQSEQLSDKFLRNIREQITGMICGDFLLSDASEEIKAKGVIIPILKGENEEKTLTAP